MTDARIKLAIDPGENTGIAWFFDGELVGCYLAAPGDTLVVPRGFVTIGDKFASPAHCVIELPQFYPIGVYHRMAKGNRRNGDALAMRVANSLIRESVTLGEWKQQARRLGMSLEEVLPRTWKGQMKKQAMLKCIVENMRPSERALVKALGLPKSLVHNVLDAVGLGLWSCDRLEVRRFANGLE